MHYVLCVSGLDPSGGAGLSADFRALQSLEVGCLPVLSASTVQNSKEFVRLQPMDARLVEDQILAALEEMRPGCAKLGLAGSADIARTVAGIMEEQDIRLVVDPILRTSTGHDLAGGTLLETYRDHVLPRAFLVTPNAFEATALTGIEATDIETAKLACGRLKDMGAENVLVKGGHFQSSKGRDVFYDGTDFTELEGERIEGNARGTGCSFAALISGYIAMGLECPEAVRRAKIDMNRVLETSHGMHITFHEDMTEEQRKIWLNVMESASALCSLLPIDMVPEVGINIAYGVEGANDVNGICSLDSRLVVKGRSVVTLGSPAFGRDSHVGRIVLVAMSGDRSKRCALNLRYSERAIDAARDVLDIGSFDRREEPGKSSSMEWGTLRVIEEKGHVPDMIYDLGGQGKEPMIRLLGNNPGEVLNKLRRLLERAG